MRGTPGRGLFVGSVVVMFAGAALLGACSSSDASSTTTTVNATTRRVVQDNCTDFKTAFDEQYPHGATAKSHATSIEDMVSEADSEVTALMSPVYLLAGKPYTGEDGSTLTRPPGAEIPPSLIEAATAVTNTGFGDREKLVSAGNRLLDACDETLATFK